MFVFLVAQFYSTPSRYSRSTARGESQCYKTHKNSPLGQEAMGNTVWSKCLKQTERERI